MDDFEEYEQAEALAIDYQRTERAEALRDEFISHDRSSGKFGPLGRYNLVGAQGLVLPPLRSAIAIGIVVGLMAIGIYAVNNYSDAGVPEAENAPLANSLPVDIPTIKPSAVVEESAVVVVEDVQVKFIDVDENRTLSYGLKIKKDADEAIVSVDAYVRGASSPVRHSVMSRCTRAVSGLRRMHTCEAGLPSTLPAGKYVFEIDAAGPGQNAKTGHTKAFKLK